MKKNIIGLLSTLAFTTAFADVSPFVSVERELNAGKNRAVVGVNVDVGSIGVEAKYNLTAPNNLKFKSEKVDVDLTYGLNDNIGVYVKNELTKSFKHNATVVGVKVSF